MCAGSREKIFVTFVNFTQPVEVMFAVMEDDEKTLAVSPLEVFKTPCGCLEIDLPHIDQARMTVTLVMYARRSMIQCKEFEVMDKIKVFLDACNSETFIETDKPVYKAGQDLKFRILTLQADLKPDLSTVSKIWVESPSGIHMEQWLDVDSVDGLVDLTMPLSDEAPMGSWKVKVLHHNREFEQAFEVGEPIASKFEVIIDGPEYVVIFEPIFDITICGRYTYGKPVMGSISMDLAVSTTTFTTKKPAVKTDDNGCYTFTVNWPAIRRFRNIHNRRQTSRLIINVEFEESVTRTLVRKTSDTTIISSYLYALQFSTPATFKPGLPYSGMVLFKDPAGNPYAGGTCQLVAATGKNWERRESLIGNDKGVAFFSLNDIPIDAEQIALVASGGAGRRRVRPEKRIIHPHYSPSKSFIHIFPVLERAKVNSYQTLTIHMISDAPDYEGVHLQTVFMSRGNILLGVETIISPEQIDGFRRPGQYGVFPINTDEMGMKEYSQSLSMKASDVPVHFLKKGQAKTTSLRFKVTHEMSPSVTVMVYYIRHDGEVMADTIDIAVEEVLLNQVSIKFADTEVLPRNETTLNILAKPSSLCAYGVMDKRVHLHGDDNLITKEKIFRSLEELQLSAEGGFAGPYSKNCPIEDSAGTLFIKGRPGSIQLPDSSQSFKNLGAVYLSNLQVETAPCSKHFDSLSNTGKLEGPMSPSKGNPVLLMAEPDPLESWVDGEDVNHNTRFYFPDTWLYNIVRVSRDGHFDVPVTVPHSITEWVGHGFCTSTRYGAGVSDLTTMKSFQPFYVDMILPNSAIRYENVPVTATVFNYLTECLAVSVTLRRSMDYKISDRNRHASICVCSQESKVVSFHIQPQVAGTIIPEVHAVTIMKDTSVCGEKQVAVLQNTFSDAIKKALVVKAEGVETQQVFSAYFCPEEQPDGTYEEIITLQDLPENYVNGTERAVVKITGDILGPAVSNLDHLLQFLQSTGYTMVDGFTLNTLVRHYLKGIKRLGQDIDTKSKANMESGYQHLLNFRREDGSYAVRTNKDAEGDVLMTARVIRSFVQAKRYIEIDPKNLADAQTWIIGQQNADTKCFESSNRGPSMVTAYSIISLIESGLIPDDQVIQDAITCLEKNIDMATVGMDTLSIVSYAYVLAGYPHKEDVFARLEQLAIESDDGMKHWEGHLDKFPDKIPAYLHRQASAKHVETTSYVLLSYIRAYAKDQVIILGKPVSRWIIAQLNAFGGFVSSQSTVVALQALAEYRLMAYSDGPQNVKLSVAFSCEETDHQFVIAEHDRLLMKSLTVPQVPVQIKMNANGPGCAMTQVIVTYNVYPEEQEKPPFNIILEKEEVAGVSRCSQYSMSICVAFNGEGNSSDKAIMEMRMLTGFEVDDESLETLKLSAGQPGKHSEFDKEGDDLFFYFNQIDLDGLCVEFKVNRRFSVSSSKKAAITVSDYYDRAVTTSELYNFPCMK